MPTETETPIGAPRPIATRELILTDENNRFVRHVTVSVFQPIEISTEFWMAEYEIAGLKAPDSIRRFQGHQVDGLGALMTAIQMAGVELEVSDAHKAGRLYWLEPGDKCGLPVPKSFEDL